MRQTKLNLIIDTLRENGVMRSRDLAVIGGVTPAYLNMLANEGKLAHAGRGMYALPTQSLTFNHSFAQAATYSDHIVICLLSALRFHDIGTQLPHVLWVAIPYGKWTPKIPDLEIEVVRMDPRIFHEGVESHMIERREVLIYSAAKTVADCFKYRSSVGMEATVEALQDGLRKKKFTPSDLYEMGTVDRVWRVMEPYVEALS